MEDAKIVALYWQRSEAAIRETDVKYGSYCRAIAYRILANREDTEECVNDTYLSAWNAMPDKRPERLSPFLGRISRNLALDRADDKKRLKRGGGETDLALEELSACIPSGFSLDRELEDRELVRLMGLFIDRLPPVERRVFLSRYYFMLPVEETAARLGFSRSKVKSMLLRTRKKLLVFLQEEGICPIK